MAGKYSDRKLKVRNGNFYYFHANGSLDASGKYKNDKKDGLWLNYYPNKMLMDSGVYSNGNIVGTRLSWHINGYLFSRPLKKPVFGFVILYKKGHRLFCRQSV